VLTLEQAKQLKPGDILLDQDGKRWKINGRVKLWKRDPNRIRVPLKHGLYRYDALTGDDFYDKDKVCELFSLEYNAI
jgi:hypothetical protein